MYPLKRHGLIEVNRFQLMPRSLVLTVKRQRVFRNGSPRRLVIVFAPQVHQIQRERLILCAINPEIEPTRLPVAAVLIGFTVHMTAKVIGRDPIDRSKVSTFEIAVKRDCEQREQGKHYQVWMIVVYNLNIRTLIAPKTRQR